jgi:hypothetical protein
MNACRAVEHDESIMKVAGSPDFKHNTRVLLIEAIRFGSHGISVP